MKRITGIAVMLGCSSLIYVLYVSRTIRPQAVMMTKKQFVTEKNTIKKEVYNQDILKKYEFILKDSFEDQKESRLLRLRNFCRGRIHPLSGEDYTERLFFNDQQAALYCEIPKAACTSWKKMLLYFAGKIKGPFDGTDKETVHTIPIPKLGKSKTPEKSRRLAVYYTFMFVRNPFDRLLSAFRNKFYHPDNDMFRKAHGINILKVSRPKAKITNYRDTYNMTFEEFVSFVIHKFNQNVPMNVHWEPMYKLCHPCSIRYDFIGKMESLIADSNIVLDNLGVNKTIRFTTRKEYKTDIDKIAKQFYSTIPNEKLSKIYEIYKDDFEAFDYYAPNYIKEIIIERAEQL